jgi:hypothetical protein
MSLISNTLQGDFVLFPNQTGGNIGTAATTVDICSNLRVNQTTGTAVAPVLVGINAPSDTSTTAYLTLSNVGTGFFQIAGVTVNPNTYINLVFTTTWNLLSAVAVPFSNTGIVFGNGAGQIQDVANLNYDSTNKRLGVGLTTPSVTLDINGAFTTRQGPVGTISNAAATLAITATQEDQTSLIKVIQTVLDCTVTLVTPVTSIAAGRFLRLHNDNTSTKNLIFNNLIITPGTFADLQWNGNVWSKEATPLSGNIIAMVSNVTPTATMDFDGYRITVPSGQEMRIATTSGTKSASWLAEQEYPGGSFSSALGTNLAPITLTTTSVTTADNTTVPSERMIMLLQEYPSNAIYRITTQRLGAVTENWSGFVEKIGVTTNQILTPRKLMLNYASVTANMADFQATPVLTLDDNIASITNVSGAVGAVAIYLVTFTTPMPSIDYLVNYEYISNAAEAAGANATVLPLETAVKTVNSFRFIIRESASTTQNFSIKFVIQHQDIAYLTTL